MISTYRNGALVMGLAAVVALVCVSISVARAIPTRSGDTGFCGRPVFRDYEAGLQDLRAVSRFPTPDELLPFASVPVALKRLALPFNNRHLIASSGLFGYSLHGPTEGGSIGWDVASEVVQIDGSGAAIGTALRNEAPVQWVGSESPGTFIVRMPTVPGRYLYRMTFKDLFGQLLATYEEYMIVVQPSIAVRLEVEKPVLRPGERVVTRIGNRSSLGISVFRRVSLERWVDSSWQSLSEKPRRGFAEIELLGAGKASHCLGAKVPPGSPPGRYRISVRFEPQRAPITRSSSRWISKTFEVGSREGEQMDEDPKA